MGERRRALQDLLDSVSGKVRPRPDWTPLLRLATETLTIGTLAKAVLAHGAEAEVPTDVRALLLDVDDRARRRNVRLKSQLTELLPSLNAIRVEPILMRGMARLLAAPVEDARLLSDIDLLIPAASRADCVKALAGLGYEVFRGNEDDGYALVFGRTRDVGMVDVHTALEPHYLKIGYARAAPLCGTIALDGGTALLPSPTGELLFNIVHDQLHDGDYWRGLIDMRHLIDIAAIVEAGVDWASLADFFPAGPVRNAFEVQLRTAKYLLKIDIPEQYVGGTWARLHLARRRVQIEYPWSMVPLTLLSIAADPPLRTAEIKATAAHSDGSFTKLRRRTEHYLRDANSGKLAFGRKAPQE